jgi:TRAP-type C4-dicarboxylate transport system substrate-binding protein
MPGLAEDNFEAGVALQKLYDKGMLRGYEDLVLIGCTTAYQYFIHSNYLIKTPEDLKGKKLKATGQMQHKLLAAVGGVPIGESITKVAESVNRGVISGLLGEPNSMDTFKVYEVVKYHLEKVNFGTSNQMIAMAKKRYDSLPANARAILDKHRGEYFARYYGERMTRHELNVKEKYQNDPRHKFYTPTAAELKQWYALMEPVIEEWKRTHPNGENLLSAYKAEIAKLRSE